MKYQKADLNERNKGKFVHVQGMNACETLDAQLHPSSSRH
jgi:hypothetical protein